MIAAEDLAHCRAAIRDGSYSFHAASRLLPGSVRDPALALYAFCRLADDEVDLNDHKPAAVLRLRDRLELVYAGTPRNAPADRAFAALVEGVEMPRALPEALLEGLAWDGMDRRYATLGELRGYSARVASAVGAMMCVIMGVRDEHALARACDLGVAMQLTNIARDVGEDARAGRLYLPTEMLATRGIDPDAFLRDPRMTDGLRQVIKTLLFEADRLYFRAEAGIKLLPPATRPGIFAARHIYDGIGKSLARKRHDSVNHRARTTKAQKIGWLGLSVLRAGWVTVTPRTAIIYARPLPETAFLVDAAARRAPQRATWGEGVISVLAQLEARDQMQQGLEQSLR